MIDLSHRTIEALTFDSLKSLSLKPWGPSPRGSASASTDFSDPVVPSSYMSNLSADPMSMGSALLIERRDDASLVDSHSFGSVGFFHGLGLDYVGDAR